MVRRGLTTSKWALALEPYRVVLLHKVSINGDYKVLMDLRPDLRLVHSPGGGLGHPVVRCHGRHGGAADLGSGLSRQHTRTAPSPKHSPVAARQRFGAF
jgi:hypothetical protein